MKKYGVGPRICRYVETIWRDQAFLLKQSGFFSNPIDVERGVTQGDTDSPIIFNLIVDAVLRKIQGEAAYGKSVSSFYADDGLVENTDHRALQRDLDNMVALFARFGLKANRDKTKFMVVRGPQALLAQSTVVYARTRKGGCRVESGASNRWYARSARSTCVRVRCDATSSSFTEKGLRDCFADRWDQRRRRST